MTENAGIWVIVALFITIFVALLILILGIILIAIFNMVRRVDRQARLMMALCRRQAHLIELNARLMLRYERNLSNWYNHQTGGQWSVTQEERKLYEDLITLSRETRIQIDETLERTAR
jgi:hypothetical protein